MYIARFSYDVLPVNRQRAIEFIRKEVEAARSSGLNARLMVPFTRGLTGAALQFELELNNLDQLDQLIGEEIEKVKAEGVTEEEFRKALNQQEAQCTREGSDSV